MREYGRLGDTLSQLVFYLMISQDFKGNRTEQMSRREGMRNWQMRLIKNPLRVFCPRRGFGIVVRFSYQKSELFFSLNFPTRLFISCDWLDSSSLAAALSCAVAEFVCTTLEIWSIPVVIWEMESA